MWKERFPGNSRSTFLETGNSQLSQRKPQAYLIRQCQISMAARGQPRLGACVPSGTDLPFGDSDKTDQQSPSRRTGQGEV